MKRSLVLAALLVAAVAAAGGIKVWVSGEAITITDLNTNFAHIHNTMVGGHGARLVNADVSASAAIASTKLADGAGIARGLGYVDNGAGSACNSSPCTVTNGRNVSGVTRSGLGVYNIAHTSTLDTKHITVVTGVGGWCYAVPGASNDLIYCFSIGAGTYTAADFVFTFAVFDP